MTKPEYTTSEDGHTVTFHSDDFAVSDTPAPHYVGVGLSEISEITEVRYGGRRAEWAV